MSSVTQHQALHPQFRLLVLLVAIGFFMQGLDTTIVNIAVAEMAKQLGENPLKMHSVVVAYVLAAAACIPLSGWLADRFGVRNTYLSAIVIFTLASLGCGLSSTLHQLLFFRVVQGIGGALLLPIGRLSMLKIIPRQQFLAAMSLMSLAGLLGPLMGPSLGGWLVAAFSWHWIFLINVPIGIIGCLLTLKIMPNVKETQVSRFDFRGFILLLISMVGLSLALEVAANPHYSSGLGWGLLGLGLLAMLAYAFHAHWHHNALFRSRLFRDNPVFSIGILGNIFARFGGHAIPFVLPLMLQVVFGIGPIETGLMMMPLVLGSLASKPIIRPMIQALGYQRFLLINTLLMGLCIASFALTTADMPLWLRSLHFFLMGLLNSLQFVSMNTLTLKDLPQQDASKGNSFLSMIQMVSMSIGVALAGTLINFFTQQYGAGQITQAFHATLICLGAINIIALLIFIRIPENA